MMRASKTRAGWVVMAAGLLGICLILSGCTGCIDSLLDRVEDSLRQDTNRPGKVGTLRALEVGQSARHVAEEIALRLEGPCDVGWTFDGPFSVNFEVHVEVQRGRWIRHWREEGSWQQDAQGRWQIVIDAQFQDGDYLEGQRHYAVFADEDGFWEWLGPELVARHRARGPVERRWRLEFGGRFSGLMALASTGWEEAGDGRWVPGETFRHCSPVDDPEAASWRPLLEARSELQRASITNEWTDDESSEHRCRSLESRYGLQDGGVMDVTFSECVGAPPEELTRPEASELVDVPSHREPGLAPVARELEKWIAEGMLEVTDDGR